MNDKIALVTGGTAGVGQSIARELVENDFTVHFIGTNAARGEALEAELNASGGTGSRFIQLDLSSLKATRDFALRFRSEVPRLDVLLNVAGVLLRTRHETAEGLEKTLAINYLSAFVLTRELVPLLEKASHPRVVNVSGAPAHVLRSRLDFEDIQFARNYSGMRAALGAVHAKTVMTEVFAQRLKSRNIDVNSFHPGLVKSELARDLPAAIRFAFAIVGPFMSKRSRSGSHASTSDEVTGLTGQLFVKTTPRPLSFEQSYKDQLWNWTVDTVDEVLKRVD